MADVREITFSDGFQTFSINGGYQIRFQPTDLQFAERIFAAMEDMGSIQARYAATEEDLPDVDLDAIREDEETAKRYAEQTRARFDAFRQIDKDLRAKIDDLFGSGTAEGVFGGINLTAYADGLPVYLNFLLAVLDQFPEQAKQEAGLSDERLKAVTARYTQKYTAMQEFHRKRRKGRKKK